VGNFHARSGAAVLMQQANREMQMLGKFGLQTLPQTQTLSVAAAAAAAACARLCDGGDAVDVDGGAAQCVMYALSNLVPTLTLAAAAAAVRLCDGGDAVDVDGGAAQCVMYARIATMEQEMPPDMTDYWQEPASYFLLKGACRVMRVFDCDNVWVCLHLIHNAVVYFLCPGALLNEAVDDLEWPGGSFKVCYRWISMAPSL
jgi:hypothetical protein